MPALYAPVVGDEKFETTIDDIESRRQHTQSPLQSRWVWLAHALLLLSSITFCIRGYIYSLPTTKIFVNEFSTYSPAASAVEYKDVLFNATTTISPPSSPYIGHDPAVDAAWSSITDVPGTFMISDRELYLLEKPETVAKVSDSKTGKSGFRVSLEVFHQLRCLDVVRRATYPISAEASSSNPVGMEKAGLSEDARTKMEEDMREEIDHCLEILRMNLMCQADIGLVTFEVEKEGEKEKLRPDFSTWHTCRNFDKVMDWARENAVTES